MVCVAFPRFEVDTVAARPNAAGYNRDDFGIWQPHGACSTREAILESQASDPLHDCHARSGTVYDPYSGTTIPATSPIEIDHIFPLSAAYDMGASEWDRETKVRFGNDPSSTKKSQMLFLPNGFRRPTAANILAASQTSPASTRFRSLPRTCAPCKGNVG